MRTLPRAFAVLSIAALTAAATHAALAQQRPPTGPAPAQAGDDPSMANPNTTTKPALDNPPKPGNPESTVGLAPVDQPINNDNPSVAGQVIPSSQMTAAHEPSIAEHDHKPTISHSFNFTAEQKQQIKAALAQDAGKANAADIPSEEAVVLPRSVEVKQMPDAVTRAMPWVRGYNYVKSGNRIAIIDPHLRYITAVIE